MKTTFENINDILTSFEPVSLEEMDSVKLMDRTDIKYSFRMEALPDFIAAIKDSYRVLEVKGHRISSYESLYFDTNNFDLYKHHLFGRLNRYKIRFRSYVESNLHFFEIKFKNNKDRTIKSRIEHMQGEYKVTGEIEQFIRANSNINPSGLEEKFQVNFSRITFVNRFAPERVTVDMNLTFINHGKSQSLDNLIIAEVKQSKPFVSAFVRLMKDHHIRQGTLSKYCFGVMNLFTQQRFNSFKPQLLLLNKLIYDPVTRT